MTFKYRSDGMIENAKYLGEGKGKRKKKGRANSVTYNRVVTYKEKDPKTIQVLEMDLFPRSVSNGNGDVYSGKQCREIFIVKVGGKLRVSVYPQFYKKCDIMGVIRINTFLEYNYKNSKNRYKYKDYFNQYDNRVITIDVDSINGLKEDIFREED